MRDNEEEKMVDNRSEDIRALNSYSEPEKDGLVMSKKTAVYVGLILVLTLALGFVLGYYINEMKPDKQGNEAMMGYNRPYDKDEVKKELEEFNRRYGDVEMVRQLLVKTFYKDIDESKFSEAMIRGMLQSLEDPYTVYFNEKEFKQFNEMSEGAYGGLGITISPGKDGFITVISTFKNSPAKQAGIQKDDKILKVEGVEYGADKMDLAVGKMRGEPDTEVTITIGRGTEVFDLKLKRALIIIESVEFEMMDKNDKIGYIKINSFDDKVAKEFKTAYNTLRNEGMKSFILDLRQNPGGSLSQCVEIADSLLGEQVILNIVEKNKEPKPIYSDSNMISLPYVVLVDSASASASEILSGAIKDSKAAVLIGTKTYGKGVVQTIWPIFKKSGIKITTSEYTTTNGNNIHGKGIEPDIVVEMDKDYKEGDRATDNQLKRALEEIRKLMK